MVRSITALIVFEMTLILCGTNVVGDQDENVSRDEARRRLEQIARNPHGVVEYSESQMDELKDWFKKNSAVILDATREKLDELISPYDLLKNSRLFLLYFWAARMADRDKGLVLTFELFRQVNAFLALVEPLLLEKSKEAKELLGQERMKIIGSLMKIRVDVVKSFGDEKDPRLINYAKLLIENDPGTSATALEYLLTFVNEDSSLKEFLKQKAQDKKSKVFEHPALEKLQ